MKSLIFISLLLIGCCPCKKIKVDYFEQDKSKYRELLGKGEITDCEYNELMIGAYEMREFRRLINKNNY